MDQMNSLAMSMLQAVAGAELPKGGKNGGTDEFQKLLEEKSQAKDPLVEEPAKSETKPQAPAPKKDKAPVQKQEDPIETSVKAQMVIVGHVQPELAGDPVTLQVPGTEEELTIMAGTWEPQVWAYESTPEEIAGDPSAVGEGTRVVDVSDPEADAILEATAPDADNSPAAMLEKLADEVAGVKEEEGEEPQLFQTEAADGDKDTEVEVTDVEQAPQRLFHDVEAAPVKVGEVYTTEQPEQPDVARQVDSQLIQAVQQGESMVRIQLTPENLGSVTVEISQKAGGVLHIALSAHNSETRGLLERHAADLQGLVSSRTQQDVEVSVQHSQESQQDQNQQHSYDGHNGHAQDQQQGRRQQHGRTNPQDFMQQLRLGLIPTDGEA